MAARLRMRAETTHSTMASFDLPEGEIAPKNDDLFKLMGVDIPIEVGGVESVQAAIHEFSKVTGISVILSAQPGSRGGLVGGPIRPDLVTSQMRPGRTYVVPTTLGIGAIYCTPRNGFAGATTVFPDGGVLDAIEAGMKSRPEQFKLVEAGETKGPGGLALRVLAVLMAARGILVTHRVMQMIQPPEKVLLELRIIKDPASPTVKVKLGILMVGDEPARAMNEHERAIIAKNRPHAELGVFVFDQSRGGFMFLDLSRSDVLGILRNQKLGHMPVPLDDRPGHVVVAKIDGILAHFGDKLSKDTVAVAKHMFHEKK